MNEVSLPDESIRQLKQLAPRSDGIGMSAYLVKLIDDEYQKSKGII